MKKIACIILIQLFLSALWALDYRQVLFSNNYERIEKVTDKESILGNGYDAIVSTIKKKVDNSPCVLYEYPNFKYNELYTEKYANGNVYRLLITDEPISTDKILNMSFDYIDQVMFLKENKGFSNANYYEWKDVQNSKKYNLIRDNVYLFDGYHNRIEIKSTRPLIDKKRPLMYTILLEPVILK